MAGNDDSSSDDPRYNARRRQLLAALGTGAAAGLAGCGGGDDGDSGDGTPTEGDTPTDIPQPGTSASTPTETEGEGTPTETQGGLEETNRTYQSFFGSQLSNMNWDIFNHRENWPRKVGKASLAFKASTDQNTGETMPMIVESWEQDDSTIKFQFSDQVPQWYQGIPSEDGEDGLLGPVRPVDWGLMELRSRWEGPSPDEIRNSSNGQPNNWWEAITDITWDNDAGTVTFHSEPGWFSMFKMSAVPNQLLTAVSTANLGRKFAIKVDFDYKPRGSFMEEYQQIKDMSWVDRREALADSPQGTATATQSPALELDPVDMPTSGVFTPTDITESHVMLEKNPGHHMADAINWPKMKLFSMPNNNLRNKALVNGRLDGINGTYVPPANVLSQLPDRYKTWIHNRSATSGLALNASRVKWFQDPRVRQAICHALDKAALAEQGHRFANTPPQDPPGLIAPEYRSYVPESLYSSYRTYDQSTERATELMEAAGFSMEGGTWRTPEDETFSIDLLAPTDSIQVPAIVMKNLKNFGIEMTLSTNSPTTVDNRKHRGDYQMTTQGWWIQHVGLWTRAIQQSDRRHRFGMISDERVDAWVDKYEDQGVVNKEYSWTNNLEDWDPEMMKYFTLPVPPVGERVTDVPPVTEWPEKDDGPGLAAPEGWRDVPVFYYAHTWASVTSPEDNEKWMKELTWATNWYLPYVPYAISAQVAVQDHGEWQAPDDRISWMQDEPVNKLMAQGKIHANPE